MKKITPQQLKEAWEKSQDFDKLADILNQNSDKPEYKRQRAEKGCWYWYIDSGGKSYSVKDYYGYLDNYRFNTGNYRLTVKEIEDLLYVQTEIIPRVKEMADGEGPPPDGKEVCTFKWLIYDKQVVGDFGKNYINAKFWFESGENWRRCLETIGQSELQKVYLAGETL